MALDTYANLKSSIEEWLDRDDLTTRIDDFIRLAEARHEREVRIRDMLERCPIGVVARYIALPFGYLAAQKFRLLEDPIIKLKNINSDHMDTVRREVTGEPNWFTVHAEIELDVIPQKSYNGEMIYYRALPGLSVSQTTNALLDRAPDIYLYSALSASAPFLMNDERIATWESLYVAAKDAINAMDQKTIGVPIATVPGLFP